MTTSNKMRELYKTVQTKLPDVHTKAERVEELKAILSNTPNTHDDLIKLIKTIINQLAKLDEGDYATLLTLGDKSHLCRNSRTAWLNKCKLPELGMDRKVDLLTTDANTGDIAVEWVVESKGDYLKGDCEVSAVIKGTHGHKSWGWPDDESKIIVLSCDNQRSKPLPIDPRIIAVAESVALEIVNEKNAGQKSQLTNAVKTTNDISKGNNNMNDKAKNFLEKQIQGLLGDSEFTVSEENYQNFLQTVKGMTFEAGTSAMALAYVTIFTMEKDPFIMERRNKLRDILALVTVIVHIYNHVFENKSTLLLAMEALNDPDIFDTNFRKAIIEGTTSFEKIIELIRKPKARQLI